VSGVHYISALDAGGYAQAGFAYVRALVNAGIPVHWTPFLWPQSGIHPKLLSSDAALQQPIVRRCDGDMQTGDLAALIDATRRPIAADAVLMHTVPEHWSALPSVCGKRVGMTVWETTALPPHWVPLLNDVDRICVPCTTNRDVFVRSGVKRPVDVIPHIRRNRWSEFSGNEVDAMRTALALKANHVTFYSINTWTLRKNMPLLVRAFCRAFSNSDAVQLTIKASANGDNEESPHQSKPSVQLLNGVLDEELARNANANRNVRLIADDTLSNRNIDMLHHLGDCFVSFTHGEGWGLGAFDAATYGNPVITPRFAASCDYFSETWSGAVPYALTAVPIWPTFQPSYWNDQRWAHVDIDDAVACLRNAFIDIDARRAEALSIQADIADQFSESRVAKQLIHSIYGC
jgi:glycosyltransferase involved in cell wall biosynthesis